MMYTAEEKKALEQLRGHPTRIETTVKQVGGGFIVSHVITYSDEEDTIIGQTRDDHVATDGDEVARIISKLYRETEQLT